MVNELGSLSVSIRTRLWLGRRREKEGGEAVRPRRGEDEPHGQEERKIITQIIEGTQFRRLEAAMDAVGLSSRTFQRWNLQDGPAYSGLSVVYSSRCRDVRGNWVMTDQPAPQLIQKQKPNGKWPGKKKFPKA